MTGSSNNRVILTRHDRVRDFDLDSKLTPEKVGAAMSGVTADMSGTLRPTARPSSELALDKPELTQ